MSGQTVDAITLLGVDFTSTPSRRKPITVARGRLVSSDAHSASVQILALQTYPDWAGFDAMLREPGPWLGGFDLPLGLPRDLVDGLGWPGAMRRAAQGGAAADAVAQADTAAHQDAWPALIRHLQAMSRAELRAVFKAWCDARPVGQKFSHRRVDPLAGSSPSMKWVNPPVAYMLHEGAPRLLAAGVTVPGQHHGSAQWPADPRRIALEAYPGWVARQVTSASYKADDKAKQTPQRRLARQQIVDSLVQGLHPMRIVVDARLTDADLLASLVDEPMADRLDAVLCLVQAAWAWLRRPGFGYPTQIDPVEGWIAGVPAPQEPR